MAIELVLTLCTAMGCNAYAIDTQAEWQKPADCREALVVESSYMGRIWNDTRRLEAYIAQFEAREPVNMLVDYDYTCERVKQQWVSR